MTDYEERRINEAIQSVEDDGVISVIVRRRGGGMSENITQLATHFPSI